jgi:hypothetical protein
MVLSTKARSQRPMKLALFASLTVALTVIASSTSGQTPATVPAPSAQIVRLARAARDADLRGDWAGLLRSHAAFEALRVSPAEQPWVDYYLGYVDWRQSSLAYMGEGFGGWAGLLQQASDHLARAVAAAPKMTEARLLLGFVDATLVATNPKRAGELGPRVRENMQRAVAEAPDNPRVKFLSAMLAFFSASGSREAKDSSLKAWEEAARSFPAHPVAGAPEWGRAESWAWLGAALLSDGNPAGARAALERAVADRKDFWWAREIALPQALHSRLGHAGGA